MAARGYSLGLACLVWAVYFLVGALGQDDFVSPRDEVVRGWQWASLLMGLSISANLIYIFPCTAVAVVFVGMLWVEGGAGLERIAKGKLVKGLVWKFAIPGPALAMVICGPVLLIGRASLQSFDMGLARLPLAASDLIDSALRHHPILWWAAAESAAMALAWVVEWVALPVIGLLMLVAAAALGARWRRAGRLTGLAARERWILLLAAGALMTGVIYLAAHVLLGVHFPDARSSLYVITFITLLTPLLGWWLMARNFAAPAVRGAGWLLAGMVLCLYLLEFNTTHFRQWRYDAGDRMLFDAMAKRGQASDHVLRMGGLMLLAPSMNYYYDRFQPMHLSRFLVADSSEADGYAPDGIYARGG